MVPPSAAAAAVAETPRVGQPGSYSAAGASAAVERKTTRRRRFTTFGKSYRGGDGEVAGAVAPAAASPVTADSPRRRASAPVSPARGGSSRRSETRQPSLSNRFSRSSKRDKQRDTALAALDAKLRKGRWEKNDGAREFYVVIGHSSSLLDALLNSDPVSWVSRPFQQQRPSPPTNSLSSNESRITSSRRSAYDESYRGHPAALSASSRQASGANLATTAFNNLGFLLGGDDAATAAAAAAAGRLGARTLRLPTGTVSAKDLHALARAADDAAAADGDASGRGRSSSDTMCGGASSSAASGGASPTASGEGTPGTPRTRNRSFMRKAAQQSTDDLTVHRMQRMETVSSSRIALDGRPRLPSAALGCPRLPSAATGCHRLPPAATGCPRCPRCPPSLSRRCCAPSCPLSSRSASRRARATSGSLRVAS